SELRIPVKPAPLAAPELTAVWVGDERTAALRTPPGRISEVPAVLRRATPRWRPVVGDQWPVLQVVDWRRGRARCLFARSGGGLELISKHKLGVPLGPADRARSEPWLPGRTRAASAGATRITPGDFEDC